MLSDQIESATEKVGDMEKLLDDKKEVSHEMIKFLNMIYRKLKSMTLLLLLSR